MDWGKYLQDLVIKMNGNIVGSDGTFKAGGVTLAVAAASYLIATQGWGGLLTP